jgi:hypothetical protein
MSVENHTRIDGWDGTKAFEYGIVDSLLLLSRSFPISRPTHQVALASTHVMSNNPLENFHFQQTLLLYYGC